MTGRVFSLKCVLAAAGVFFATIVVDAAGPTLDIYWVDVDGGGATLIVTPARQSILIDTGWARGPSAKRIAQAATDAGVKKIDYLVTTHFHLDHFGGAAELATMMPIVSVMDNGIPPRNPDNQPDGGAFTTMIQPYRDFAATRRSVIDPGQTLSLWQLNGTAQVSFRCMGTRCHFAHGAKDPTNTLSLDVPDHPVDTTDNKNSAISLLQFGPFKFYDGGDLTWNMEKQLVFPTNSIGRVDVYQTDHHGVDLSNNPWLIKSLTPTVSVMNNGARKGCSPATLATLRATPSIQAMFQVHKDIRGEKEFNTDDPYIANIAEKCAGNYIKCSVASDGKSYTISIPATGFSKTFQTMNSVY